MIKHNAKLAPVVIAIIMILTLWEGVSTFTTSDTSEPHTGVVLFCEDCGEPLVECHCCENLYHEKEPHCSQIQSDLKGKKYEII